jgi:nucleoside-diphosphate-sugar epimerase
MKNILITGGGGFIGTHLRHKLEEQGHKVQILDINHPDQDAGQDVTKERSWATLPDWHVEEFVHVLPNDGNDPDVVVHMAAQPNLRAVKENPKQAYKTMTAGVMNIINRFLDTHFIFISSSMVYGNFNNDGVDETYPLRPIDPYGRLKLIGEDITKALHDKWTIVRPSAVYGPNDNLDRVIPIWIKAAMNDEVLKVNGTRTFLDFTYVEDLCDGLIATFNNDDAIRQTFNITRGKSIPIENVAKYIIKTIGKGTVEIRLSDMNYPERGTLNIDKAKKILGYNPKWDFTEGVEKTIELWNK